MKTLFNLQSKFFTFNFEPGNAKISLQVKFNILKLLLLLLCTILQKSLNCHFDYAANGGTIIVVSLMDIVKAAGDDSWYSFAAFEWTIFFIARNILIPLLLILSKMIYRYRKQMLYLFSFSACPRKVLFSIAEMLNCFWIKKEKSGTVGIFFCWFTSQKFHFSIISLRFWTLNPPKPKWRRLNLYLIYESFK